MQTAGRMSNREEAQELMWDAMDVIARDQSKAAGICRRALELYPHSVDALAMLAELECGTTKEFVTRMRAAVDAGRIDLGTEFFRNEKGSFWGLVETRPFMRAMQGLAYALLDWGTPDRVDEAIRIFEEMLELNPNDNQGVRDPLVACYLARKRYDDASALLARYSRDGLATPAWAKVLLAFVVEGEQHAARALRNAQRRNPHVQDFLTGRKRRPRVLPDYYSPGEESEAAYCAVTLCDAWQRHPAARKWLKSVCAMSK